MTRPVLDPTHLPEGLPATTVIERLPPRVREFGFYPDTSAMQAGDLVLVRATGGISTGPVISAGQSLTHGKFDAQWSHAATFLGDDSLVEMGTSGVGVCELHKYVGNHLIHIRRPLGLDGKLIDVVTGYRIAVAALKMQDARYATKDLWRIIQRALKLRGPRWVQRSPEAICSDYYNDAVARVLGRGAASAKVNPFSPADLAASNFMRDVPVSWLALVKEA